MEKVEGNYLANHHLGVIEINHAISRQGKRFTGYANSLERWNEQLKRFYAEFVSGFCCNRDENDGWERELFARSGFQLILRPDLILFSL